MTVKVEILYQRYFYNPANGLWASLANGRVILNVVPRIACPDTTSMLPFMLLNN
ncbi:MAG: hypothetical protein IPK11_15700 [Ignavibacteria bacterium]|nr:hypothetical protein [Ignavibacteria bacterium]